MLPENTCPDSSQLYSLICGVAGLTGKVVYGTVGLPARICRLHLLPTNTRSVVTDGRASTPDEGYLGYQMLAWRLTEEARTPQTVKWDN